MDINNNKINWLNIITNNEFQSSLNLKLLKDLSMVSKLFREKLKPLIFRSIVLSPKNILKFNIKRNLFCEYFNHGAYSEWEYKVSRKVKKFNIYNGLKDLDKALDTIKQYAGILKIANVNRAGYYMFPLLGNFYNLIELELVYCYISYSEFYILGESCPNLKRIQLNSVTLIKLANDRRPHNDIILSPNLSYLGVFQCGIIKNMDEMDPYNFLFDHNTRFTRRMYALPRIKVPSLKQLSFFGDSIQGSGLKGFLDLNPNLESLITNFFDSSLFSSYSTLKNLEIGDVNDFCTNTHITPVFSVTKLKIKMPSMDYFNDSRDLKTFCAKFPNLEELDLKPYYYISFQTLTNRYLAQIILNFPKLKTLKLRIVKEWSGSESPTLDDDDNDDDDDFEYSSNNGEILDITNFSQIEKLYLTSNSSVLLNTNFEKCKSLKEIAFYTTSFSLNTEEFMQKFKGYKGWKFKFSSCTIKGIKLFK